MELQHGKVLWSQECAKAEQDWQQEIEGGVLRCPVVPSLCVWRSVRERWRLIFQRMYRTLSFKWSWLIFVLTYVNVRSKLLLGMYFSLDRYGRFRVSPDMFCFPRDLHLCTYYGNGSVLIIFNDITPAIKDTAMVFIIFVVKWNYPDSTFSHSLLSELNNVCRYFKT